MPCYTRLKPNYRRTGRRQTITERKAEVKAVNDAVDTWIKTGKVKTVIGPQGAVAFKGATEADQVALDSVRDGVTDACVLRHVMQHGSAAAKMAIQRAELTSGRRINMQAVAQGVHSHDHGATWHGHKG